MWSDLAQFYQRNLPMNPAAVFARPEVLKPGQSDG